MGPVEYLIVEFPGNKFKGEIVPALQELTANGTIRILPGDPGEPDLYKMLLEQQVDVITFTSPSTGAIIWVRIKSETGPGVGNS